MAPHCDSLSLYAACTSSNPNEQRAGLEQLAAHLYMIARVQLNSNQYDDSVAQECAQIATIAIYQQLHSQKGPNNPKSFCAWATTVVINKCLDRIRRDRRHPAAPLDNTAETIADAHEKSPEHLVIFDEKRIELILSIQSHPDLSDNSKTTLIQGYFFEKTDQEIADLLAQKPANIRLIRHRTLEKLRNDDDFCTRLRNLA